MLRCAVRRSRFVIKPFYYSSSGCEALESGGSESVRQGRLWGKQSQDADSGGPSGYQRIDESKNFQQYIPPRRCQGCGEAPLSLLSSLFAGFFEEIP